MQYLRSIVKNSWKDPPLAPYTLDFVNDLAPNSSVQGGLKEILGHLAAHIL